MLPKPDLSRVILLGTGDFRSEQLPDLPAVGRNLIDLHAVLCGEPEGIVDAANSTIILNPDSPRSFMEQLRKKANQAEDFLFVYYAGHGVRHDRHDKLYLTTRETDLQELDSTAVPFEAVSEVIENSHAHTRLLVLDCCYSGLALGKMSATGPDMQAIKIAGTTVITSCPRNEISLSPVGDRNTAFTAELLSLLRSGSPVPDAPLDVHRLFGSLRAAMDRRGLPLPKMQAGDTSGALWLRRPHAPAWEATDFEMAAKPQRALPSLPTGAGSSIVQPIAREVEQRPVVQQSMVAVPQTVATPPERPAPRSQPAATVPRPKRRFRPPRRLLAGAAFVRSVLQWTGSYFFLSYGVGCVVGAVFGPTPGVDLASSAALLPIGALFAFFLARRRLRKRGLRGWAAFKIAFPRSAWRAERTPVGLLWGGALGSLAMAVAAVVAPFPSSPSTEVSSVSDLALIACLVILSSALCVTLGHRLYRTYWS